MDSSDQPVIRRSTRSTRGSIKPIVNISVEKEDSSSEKSEDEGEKAEVEYEPVRSKPAVKQASTKKKQPTQKKSKSIIDKKSKPKLKSDLDLPDPQLDPGSEINDTVTDYKLSKEERMDVEKAFDTYDTECNNFVHRKDLKNALRALGYEPRAEEIQRLTHKYVGLVREDMISREDFHELVRIRIGSMQKPDQRLPEEISKVFELFDMDNTGKITFQNLKAIAKELGEKISDEELQEMIDEADQDGDHQVDESEFLNIMKKTSLY